MNINWIQFRTGPAAFKSGQSISDQVSLIQAWARRIKANHVDAVWLTGLSQGLLNWTDWLARLIACLNDGLARLIDCLDCWDSLTTLIDGIDLVGVIDHNSCPRVATSVGLAAKSHLKPIWRGFREQLSIMLARLSLFPKRECSCPMTNRSVKNIGNNNDGE